jgi:phage shock protein PspC (stress-responsive transcriptional regulator)
MSMRKVITIHLHGTAYQIEDVGYELLRSYLAQAEAQLAANPDRQEILADLEQALGDKCDGFLSAHKNVVLEAEVAQILREIGPVEAMPASDAAAQAAPAATAAGEAGTPRRLYRIREKALLAGVCTGLAAYFGIDVVLVRVAIVVLTLCTGVVALGYLAMVFIVPRAETPAELAAAHGLPFSARDVVARAKKKYEAFRAA